MCLFQRALRTFYKYKRKLTLFFNPTTEDGGGVFIRKSSTANENRLKILFFGTDDFSLPSLQKLHKDMPILDVVTSFKKPANCVRMYSEENGLKLYRWPINPEICQSYDLGVVVSFGHMIPNDIIKSFPFGMINVHASLLPRWRGAAPIMYAIMHGDKETGVTIMKVEPYQFDIGDILAQESTPIASDTFLPELHNRLARNGASLLSNVIKGYPTSFQNPVKQDISNITMAPKITSKITEVQWNAMTATQVYNRYRGLYSFKQLTTNFREKIVQLIDLKLPADTQNSLNIGDGNKAPGSIIYNRDKKCLCVFCADQTSVEIYKLRMQGKKAMSAADFFNGFLQRLEKRAFIFTINNKKINCG